MGRKSQEPRTTAVGAAMTCSRYYLIERHPQPQSVSGGASTDLALRFQRAATFRWHGPLHSLSPPP